MNPSECFCWKPHGALQLIIFLNDVGQPFAAAKVFPADKSFQPSPVPEDWHRKITSVQNPRDQRLRAAFRNATAADRHVESTGVTIKIWIARGHLDEDIKIIRIDWPAFGATVRGDHCDAA